MSQEVVEQRPLGELFGELAQETGTLVRKEVELVKTEMTAKLSTAAKEAALVGLGGAIAHLGGMALLAALILGLGTLIPMWLSALIVGAVVCCTGGALAMSGVRKLKNIDPVPRMTVQTLKEDKRWLSEQASR